MTRMTARRGTAGERSSRRCTAAAVVLAAAAVAAMPAIGADGLAHAQEAAGPAQPQAVQDPPSAEADAAPADPDALPVDTTITIRSTGSSLEFLPAEVAAPAGARVRLRFVNDGTLPHNVVLMKDEADIDMLGQAAFEAADTEYVPLEYEDRMYAYSDLAAPGETVEMTFEVPPPGEYFYVCLYSGHYNMMYGILRSIE
ncbi:MAG: plastocyanin/azurin family copper-binding protein [Gemmatimonadota bacterium]